MAHSWFPVLSPSVFSPFLCVMFFWSNNISQWMALLWSAVIVIACIKKKTLLGVPISIQIQLSIQGNNINHIISYHDDKVGLALSVSCRKSSASFFLNIFYWIWPNALAFMLVFMSGKLLFDIQITSGGFSPMLREHRENCKAPPSPQSAMMDWF